MSREVSFAVSCADTRLGFHVRVVGNCSALGKWDPPSGLPLLTSATEFPTWRSTSAAALEQEEIIEYKYVICDTDGRQARWEDRPNRTMHLSALAKAGVFPEHGCISVLEAFNTGTEPDEIRFRPVGDSLVHKSSTPSRQFSNFPRRPSTVELTEQTDMASTGARSGEACDDLFAPTIRERMPSTGMLMHAVHSDHASGEGMRNASRLPPEATDGASTSPEITGLAEGADIEATPAEPSELRRNSASELGMAREESSSNLFTNVAEGDLVQELSEFEHRYSLVGNGPLGEGTFGLVWRCTPKQSTLKTAGDEPMKERAAKIVRKARLKERDMRYLLGEDGEVRTHLTMKHPHIVTLYEFFDEAHSVTLVLEYCRGGDLFDAIVRQSKATGRGFTEQAAAIVAQHVLSALEYIHGHSVVHRDIKCENILLAHVDVPVERNVYKLCDFGFASHDRGSGLTDRLGSPDTVAPEVVVGKRYSTPADLWSTGVLIYMMLSATPPFYAPSDGEVLQKVQQGSYEFVGKLWDSISAPPKAMIASLMTVEPKMRPTAGEALQAEWLRQESSVDA